MTQRPGRPIRVYPASPFARLGADVDDEDFTAAYCDACGTSVRARGVISLPSGRALTYCFHHLNKYRSAAQNMGALVVELVNV